MVVVPFKPGVKVKAGGTWVSTGPKVWVKVGKGVGVTPVVVGLALGVGVGKGEGDKAGTPTRGPLPPTPGPPNSGTSNTWGV